MEWSISFNLYFFPSIIFLRHKSRCHPETLESDPETLESDPETLESVKRQAERPQGHIVQVKWITLAAQNEQVTQYPEQHLEDRTVALDKFESIDSRPFISRLVCKCNHKSVTVYNFDISAQADKRPCLRIATSCCQQSWRWPLLEVELRDAFVSKKCSFFEHCSKGL